MTERKTAKEAGKANKGFTAEERDAIRERAQELKAATRRGAGKADAALVQKAAS